MKTKRVSHFFKVAHSNQTFIAHYNLASTSTPPLKAIAYKCATQQILC